MSKDGENNLILIDRDMHLLSEKAISIKKQRDEYVRIEKSKCSSYYVDCKKSKLYPNTIFIYDFKTARDLSRMLREMWNFQEKNDMEEIVSNCVASTYKYLDYKPDEQKKSEISPFIYEF